MEFSRDDVDAVYNGRMLSARGSAELSHIDEWLRMALGADLWSLAGELLTEAAVTGRLTPKACHAVEND